MSENKFIKKLKGEPTTGSLVEIKNSSTPTSFGNMPHGTSDPIVKYSDHRGNATVVAKGTQNWKLSGGSLLLASTVSGDGNDYTGEFQTSGNGLWVNATYTFPTDPNSAVSAIFNSGTKWVLKLCGHNLFSSNETVDLTLLVKIGTTNIMSKTFTVRRKALQFCEELVIDYTESLQSVIKVQGGTVLTVQVLCGDASASATIYNGMTVLTVLQRMVDSNTVASANHTFEDLEDDIADIQDEITDIHGELDGKVNIDGTSIMTAPLKFMSGSVRGAVGPYFNGVGFWKLDSQGNLTQIASISDSQFIPTTTETIDFGNSTKKWKNLYLSGNAYFDKDKVLRFNGTEYNRYFDIYNTSDTLWFSSKYGSYEASLSFRAYTGAVTLYPNNDNQAVFGLPTRRWQRVYATNLCSDTNGVNLIGVPNKAGTIALMSDVELAANSGSQLYSTGVWYAKMYSATTVPTGAEYDGTNYADFSQVDSDNNPIIVIYEGQSGAWVQIDTITPPATYNGYLYITSKIWDIVEQTDQQGGQVLWSYSQKTFTPYPRIISFDNANITNSTITTSTFSGTATLDSGSTITMPATPTGDSIVNVDYLATHNGTGRNVGDIFFTARTDSELNGSVQCDGATYSGNDFTGSQSPVALMEAGKIPYVSLSQYATLLSTNGSVGVFGWDGIGTTDFRVPSLNDIFIETGTTAQTGDYVAPGLPNITAGVIARGANFESPSGAFTADTVTTNRDDVLDVNGNTILRFNASSSNAIYGASTTVQPKSVRYRAMVQLAVSTTDEAVLTCTGVTTDVAQLKDLSNLTATGKATGGHLAMPSGTYDPLTIGATGTTYTAPADGYFWFGGLYDSANAVTSVVMRRTSDRFGVTGGTDGRSVTGGWCAAVLPVSKGDTIAIYYINLTADYALRFYYANGAA